MSVTWTVEDFRKNTVARGSATTLTPAKAAAERAARDLERPLLQAVKATVTDRPANGAVQMFNLKAVTARRWEWAKVEVAL